MNRRKFCPQNCFPNNQTRTVEQVGPGHARIDRGWREQGCALADGQTFGLTRTNGPAGLMKDLGGGAKGRKDRRNTQQSVSEGSTREIRDDNATNRAQRDEQRTTQRSDDDDDNGGGRSSQHRERITDATAAATTTTQKTAKQVVMRGEGVGLPLKTIGATEMEGSRRCCNGKNESAAAKNKLEFLNF